VELFKPTLADVSVMQRLVRPFSEAGVILPRSEEEVAGAIRSYTAAREGEVLIGFGALYIYNTALAEIRSLAVDAAYQGRGVGAAIVRALIEEARHLGLKQVMTLTYHVGFFTRMGFHEVPKEEIWHQKVWEDCIRCKHFPVCNESALILEL
jgi:amino-acid N-acetyltransferase